MPWGLDSRKSATTCQPGPAEQAVTSCNKLAQLDATLLGRTGGNHGFGGAMNAWKSQVSWLDELADWWNMAISMHFRSRVRRKSGNPQGGAFSSRSTSYCLGSVANAWGCRGRVLHYVAR